MRSLLRISAFAFSSVSVWVASTAAQQETYVYIPVRAQALPAVTLTGGQSQTIDLQTYFGVGGVVPTATVAQFKTVVGTVNAELLSADAPKTVENFLTYVNGGAYNNSVIHRLSQGFVAQGGGFTATVPSVAIPANAPVTNEYKLSNLRGTMAMAKFDGGTDPVNSATNQWFFNLADNSANLNTQNGGFAVFARVIGKGMDVINVIANTPIYNGGGAFNQVPLRNYTTGDVQVGNLVTVNSITAIPVFPASNGAAAVLRFQVSGGGGVVTPSLNGKLLTLTPVPGATGTAEVNILTTDTDGLTASGTITVTTSDFGISAQPADAAVSVGQSATFSVALGGAGAPIAGTTYQWSFNGQAIAGATQASHTVANVQPASVGLYSVRVTAPGKAAITSRMAVLGVQTTSKVVGAGAEIGANIAAPNGNLYDQVLLQGAAATVTADAGQVTRVSFVDLSNDIVQVEFSGSGSLTVKLENATGPALPVNYNQSTSYMKGHATLVIVGAKADTNVSIFSVGTATATNASLFKTGVTYDGVADLSLLAIASADGRFGGIRAGNAEFMNTQGLVGIIATGVGFSGPVNIHELSAVGSASPFVLTGWIDAGQVGVAGGEMYQPNGAAIAIGSAPTFRMLAGATSHGVALPARANTGRYERHGVNVTAQVVRGP